MLQTLELQTGSVLELDTSRAAAAALAGCCLRPFLGLLLLQFLRWSGVTPSLTLDMEEL